MSRDEGGYKPFSLQKRHLHWLHRRELEHQSEARSSEEGEQAIEDLTSAAKQAAEEIVTQFEAFPLDLVTRSNDIRVKYETIFKAFAKCHKGYSHTNSMTNEEISNLDCSIKHFLAKYRELFPTSSVSVKMHLLEEHVIPWIRCWGVGLGFHGEQGVEQVHAVFNRINRSTSSIPDAVRRLKSTLETHLLQVHPGRQDGVNEYLASARDVPRIGRKLEVPCLRRATPRAR
ncbi:hypothetical protein Bbelb_362110 [Branchiostoma belcheri]|nr:hypothetical protein Bbelb_362110 [Branchiostoma belcheri]